MSIPELKLIELNKETTYEEWLDSRKHFLGGSDASAVLGLNPYKTNIEVWQEKTGRVVPEDISGKPYVKYGKEAEEPLAMLFALDYPQYQTTPNKTYKVYHHPQHIFIAGTLDAELIELATGRQGILEIKTTEILNSMHREKWNDQVPMNYFVQCLHYLLATSWNFVILKAQLKTVYGEEVRLNTRHYHIERADVQEDLDYLLRKEIEFWWHVQNDVKPSLVLPPI